MRPLLGFADLLDILAVVVVLVLARLLASSSFTLKYCTMYQENFSSMMRSLLCSTGHLDTVLTVLMIIFVRLIASLMMRKRSSHILKTSAMPESDHGDYEHEMDEVLVAKLMSSKFDDHDIFLSHSGKQKGFVTDLYKMLHSMGYTAFFDVTHHSLPPGDIFPPLILDAATRCRLAVVVLSHEFLLSKWPMIELCAFVQAQTSIADQSLPIKILPIFYKLSPSDLKLKQNLKKWREAWKAYAKYDTKRFDVEKCEHALHNLSKYQGVSFSALRLDGAESTYMRDILSSISKIVKPTIKHDTSGIQGRKRLCKIIVDKFEYLSARYQSSKVCVLGMYGLPGSGKSTLSKCLCDHYVHEFHGRAFYMKIPSSPSDDELVKISKDLLVNITNFFDRVDLGIVLELGQVYSLLERHLHSFRVFLVVDNIMPNPCVIEFVQRLLMCNFKAGSKVLLVARTFHVLNQLLIQGDIQGEFAQCNRKYARGSIEVPGINKEEAFEILVQSAGSAQLLESRTPMHELDSKDRKIIEKIIHMSCFETKYQIYYLPLVVKFMGSQLRDLSCRSYIEGWHNDMESTWKKVQMSKVQLSKEEAVMQLVQSVFDELPKRLRFLFLDVALFILPLSYGSPLSVLSVIHETTPERIEMDMFDLQRRCFLENVEWNDIRIHDVFLQFARNCSESWMYYVNSRHDLPRELPPPSEKAMIFGLRGVVVELDEEHERFDFWEGIPSVTALVLRHCKSLKVLGLPIGLKSLVSLDIDNCPNFVRVEVGEEKSISSIMRSFTWNKRLSKSILAHSERPAPMEVSSLLFKTRWLQNLRLVNTGIKRFEDMSCCWPQLRHLEIVEGCLEHLEVGNLLCLEDFAFDGGGGSDLKISECWDLLPTAYDPWMSESAQQREVDLFESNEEPTDNRDQQRKQLYKRLCGWPTVKSLLFGCTDLKNQWGQNVLSRCPSLKNISVFAACSEDGLGTLVSSQLSKLLLGSFWHAASLPDLWVCRDSLVAFFVWECRHLTNINFMYSFAKLREMHILSCHSLVQVNGLDHLYSLRVLWIAKCAHLQTLNGLSGLVSLDKFFVVHCVQLQTLIGLGGLVHLRECNVGRGCPNLQILPSDLQNLTNLHWLDYYQYSSLPGIFNSVSFGYTGRVVTFCRNSGVMGVQYLAKLGSEPDIEVVNMECSTNVSVSQLADLVSTTLDVHIKGVLNLASVRGIGLWRGLTSLMLENLHNLSSLEGIEILNFLRDLRVENCDSIKGLPSLSPLVDLCFLTFKDLHNLSCLQGIKNLTHLKTLWVEECNSVEGLPSLSALRNLRELTLRNCWRLKCLKICDAMPELESVDLIGCKRMACLSLNDAIISQLFNLRLCGNKFATLHALKMWIVKQHNAGWSDKVDLLGWALAEAMLWKYRHLQYDGQRRMKMAKRVLETVGVDLNHDYPMEDVLEMGNKLALDRPTWRYWKWRFYMRVEASYGRGTRGFWDKWREESRTFKQMSQDSLKAELECRLLKWNLARSHADAEVQKGLILLLKSILEHAFRRESCYREAHYSY